MAISDALHEAEADLAALAELPGAIRDKVKAGLAELQRIHDAVDVELARIADAAKTTLASLQATPAAPGGAPAAETRADSVPGSFGG